MTTDVFREGTDVFGEGFSGAGSELLGGAEALAGGSGTLLATEVEPPGLVSTSSKTNAVATVATVETTMRTCRWLRKYSVASSLLGRFCSLWKFNVRRRCMLFIPFPFLRVLELISEALIEDEIWYGRRKEIRAGLTVIRPSMAA